MRRIRLGKGVWLNSKTKTNINTSNTLNTMVSVRFGVSFPKSLAKKLDQIRGDIPRSLFLQRIFEESMESKR